MTSSLTTEVGPAHFYTRKKKKTTLQLPYLGNFLDYLSVVSAFVWFLWNYNFNFIFNKLKVYNFNFWLSILSQGLYLRPTLIAFPTLSNAEQEAWILSVPHIQSENYSKHTVVVLGRIIQTTFKVSSDTC